MSLHTVLKNIWKAEAKNPVRGFLKPSQIREPLNVAPIQPNEHYVRLWLRRFHLPYSRVGTTKYHAALVAEFELQHEEGGRVEFKKLIAPPELAGVPAGQKSNIVVESKELAGPVPYRGEAVGITAGLLAVPSGDLAGPFLATLEGFAAAAGGTYLAAVKPFLEPLGNGMRLLAEATGTSGLKIGIDMEISAPQSGVYVMIDDDEIKFADLVLEEGYVLTNRGKALDEHAYFVLSLDSDTRRDDWTNIPDLKQAYEAIKTAVRDNRTKELPSLMKTFRARLLLHPDLLQQHADTLYNDVAARVEAFENTRTGMDAALELPPLEALDPFARN